MPLGFSFSPRAALPAACTSLLALMGCARGAQVESAPSEPPPAVARPEVTPTDCAARLHDGRANTEPVESAKACLPDAEAGKPYAQFALGMLLELHPQISGLGDGAQWIERAATAGNPWAMFRFGMLLLEGERVPLDRTRGIALLQQVRCMDAPVGEDWEELLRNVGAEAAPCPDTRGLQVDGAWQGALEWSHRDLEFHSEEGPGTLYVEVHGETARVARVDSSGGEPQLRPFGGLWSVTRRGPTVTLSWRHDGWDHDGHFFEEQIVSVTARSDAEVDIVMTRIVNNAQVPRSLSYATFRTVHTGRLSAVEPRLLSPAAISLGGALNDAALVWLDLAVKLSHEARRQCQATSLVAAPTSTQDAADPGPACEDARAGENLSRAADVAARVAALLNAGYSGPASGLARELSTPFDAEDLANSVASAKACLADREKCVVRDPARYEDSYQWMRVATAAADAGARACPSDLAPGPPVDVIHNPSKCPGANSHGLVVRGALEVADVLVSNPADGPPAGLVETVVELAQGAYVDLLPAAAPGDGCP